MNQVRAFLLASRMLSEKGTLPVAAALLGFPLVAGDLLSEGPPRV
jgi:hypothetical protein